MKQPYWLLLSFKIVDWSLTRRTIARVLAGVAMNFYARHEHVAGGNSLVLLRCGGFRGHQPGTNDIFPWYPFSISPLAPFREGTQHLYPSFQIDLSCFSHPADGIGLNMECCAISTLRSAHDQAGLQDRRIWAISAAGATAEVIRKRVISYQ